MTTPLLVLNGTIGAGKTTMLGELTELLVEADESFMAIDLDTLTQAFPRPVDDPFSMRLGVENLAAVWANAASRGIERLVVATVLETAGSLSSVLDTIPGADPVVVLLTAPAAELERRIRKREVGSALEWHLERSRELSLILDRGEHNDLVVATEGREPREVALEILSTAGWPYPVDASL